MKGVIMDDEEFFTYLSDKYHWYQGTLHDWVLANVPRLDGEDVYEWKQKRGWQLFRDSQPVDYKFYLELRHHLQMVGDPYIHYTPALVQEEIQKGQRAEQNLYGFGWSLEDIAQVCVRVIGHVEMKSYRSWADAKLRENT
jgi:hypothetical protein